MRRMAGLAIGVTLLLAACGYGETGPADGVTFSAARLHGDVRNTRAETTAWWFEYRPTVTYGHETPHQSAAVASPATGVSVIADLAGLAAGTEYHYRLCARGVDGRGTCGADATFATSGRGSVSGSGIVADLGFGYVIGGSAQAASTGTGEAATGTAVISPGSLYFKIADSGPVSCVDVVGNRAAVGFESFVDLGQPDPQPVHRVLYVEDNGPTGDRIGFGDLAAPYDDCPTPTASSFPPFRVGPESVPSVLGSGDFTVTPAPTG